MKEEVRLMKGNEALAHATIRYGADGYFGYPITPQSEVLETLMAEKPWETTGMVVLQAESEISSINMVYGGAKKRQSRFHIIIKSRYQFDARRNVLFSSKRTSSTCY